jgi:hypothetical protein
VAAGIGGCNQVPSASGAMGMSGTTDGSRFSAKKQSWYMRMLPTGRGVLVVALIAVMVAALFFDSRSGRPEPAESLVRPAGAAPASASSSAWYCPMTYAIGSDPTAGSVVVLNPTAVTMSGSMSVFVPGQAAVDVPLNVPARTRSVYYPGQVVDAALAGVVVRFDGGGASVEHSVRSSLGEAFAPCSSQASSRWFFADGSTQAGVSLSYGLMNPFLEDAIVDVSFVTNEGNVEPDEFQGVVIPARSVVTLDVGERVRRREWVAADINVRGGRIVASSLQIGTLAGIQGTGLTLGAPIDDDNWYFADGTAADGVTDQLVLFNPNQAESEVEVRPLTDQGQVLPFQLHVPSLGRVVLDLGTDDRMPRSDPNAPFGNSGFGLSVRTVNGVRIVAQQTASAFVPAVNMGAFTHVGTNALANRWIVANSATKGPADTWVYIVNPGALPARVKVTGVGLGGETLPSEGVIEPGRRLLVHVDEFAADNTEPGLVVESDQPVVTGRRLQQVPGVGFSSALATSVR